MLNRTVRLAKRPAGSDQPDPDAVRGLADGEKLLAGMTRELADFMQKCANERCEYLYQAEDSMLASATSLMGQDLDQAGTQEKDALANLIKARDTLRILLSKSDQATMQAFRSFDRTQTQKLRRPEEKKEEAAQLASRLNRLADQEEIVYATLSGIKLAETAAKPSQQAGGAQTGSDQPQSPPDEKGQPPSPPQGDQQSQQAQPSQSDRKRQQDQQGRGQQSQGQQASGGRGPSPRSEDDALRKDRQTTDEEPGAGDRQRLDDLQREIVDEAYAIGRIMEGIDALTELARERMDRATEKAEQVSGALARGNSEQAAEAAGQAGPMFRELAQHVEGLLAEEAPGRIAAARDLAGKLARRQRELGDRLPTPRSPSPSSPSPQAGQEGPSRRSEAPQPGQQEADASGQASGTPRSKTQPGARDGPGSGGPSQDADLANRALRLAESGRTLEDLLRALAQGDEEAGAEVIEEIDRLLREGELPQAVLRMRQIERLLQRGDLRVARVETHEVSEYLDALNLRLDTLHRLMVAPRIEELLALERRATELRDALKTLESRVEIDDWHRLAEAFVRDLAQHGVVADGAVDLLAAMRDAGWGNVSGADWDWVFRNGYYLVPSAHEQSLDTLVVELQQHVRELLLRDLMASDDEATPPEYRDLVDRYFQVLSQDIKGN